MSMKIVFLRKSINSNLLNIYILSHVLEKIDLIYYVEFIHVHVIVTRSQYLNVIHMYIYVLNINMVQL